MKPTADIVEELRLYNRWRRGDEAITAPDPTTLGKLIDDAADRIEHLFASGIHTCHDDCKRPVCVLRRERDKALADLAALRARVESATSGLRTGNPLADPVMGGLPRYDGGKLSTPAKHPDTERLDWLEETHAHVTWTHGSRPNMAMAGVFMGVPSIAESARSAIDNARKQGGTP